MTLQGASVGGRGPGSCASDTVETQGDRVPWPDRLSILDPRSCIVAGSFDDALAEGSGRHHAVLETNAPRQGQKISVRGMKPWPPLARHQSSSESGALPGARSSEARATASPSRSRRWWPAFALSSTPRRPRNRKKPGRRPSNVLQSRTSLRPCRSLRSGVDQLPAGLPVGGAVIETLSSCLACRAVNHL